MASIQSSNLAAAPTFSMKTGHWKMLGSPSQARSPPWTITQPRDACSNTSPGHPASWESPSNLGLLPCSYKREPGGRSRTPAPRKSGFSSPHSDTHISPLPSPRHTLGRCFYGEAAEWGPELGGPEFKPQLCHRKPRLPHYNLGWKPCPPATLTASTEQLLTIIISTIINKGG